MFFPSNITNHEYYDILGVSKSATNNEIKKAFYNLAKKHHPDKGGDAEQFKIIYNAYETLSNPKKRKLYNLHGEHGNEELSRMPDIFRDIINQMNTSNRRGVDIVFPLKVTLEDLYNGAKKKLRIKKNVLCMKCDGQGNKNGIPSKKCDKCDGLGYRITVRHLGIGMIRQLRTICDNCNGEGIYISDLDKCVECKGKKIVKSKKILNVNIGKGMKNNQKIIFEGESDQLPNIDPGNVIIVLKQQKHSIFHCEKLNLITNIRISLADALCGGHFAVPHLNKRILRVKIGQNNKILSPDDIEYIENEGMPQYKNPYVFGKMIIKFKIEFPSDGSISNDQKKIIRSILEAPINTPNPM